MGDNKNLWRKTSFIGIKEPILDIIECKQITIIWSKTSILGYNSQQNKILWQINTPSFLFGSTEKRLRNFNGKAVFSVGIGKTSLKDLIFAIEPETGEIIWSYGEGQTRTFILIPSKMQSKIMPVYNRRKEGFVENKYIVSIDLDTGKRLQETKLPLFYHRGLMADNHIFASDICNQLVRADMNSADKTFTKVSDGQIDFLAEIDGSVYYLLKDKDKKFTINKIDLSNNQATSLEWPHKKSEPTGTWEILENYSKIPHQLFLSWTTESDMKKNNGNTKFGILDFDQQKLIWNNHFDCHRRFLPTHDGFFAGVLFFDNNGNNIESGIKINFVYPNVYFYNNNSLFYFNGAQLEINKWCEASQEAQKADNKVTKIYNFNDLVKM
jgi:hypothetical protein